MAYFFVGTCPSVENIELLTKLTKQIISLLSKYDSPKLIQRIYNTENNNLSQLMCSDNGITLNSNIVGIEVAWGRVNGRAWRNFFLTLSGFQNKEQYLLNLCIKYLHEDSDRISVFESGKNLLQQLESICINARDPQILKQDLLNLLGQSKLANRLISIILSTDLEFDLLRKRSDTSSVETKKKIVKILPASGKKVVYTPPQEGSRVGKRASNLNAIKKEHGFITGPLAEFKDFKVSYEQILLAQSKTLLSPPKCIRLIKINELNKTFQGVFTGIENFNKMQSSVFNHAYRTAHNMLVCAPTGSGKTNVAFLCILQTIESRYLEVTQVHRKPKIIYVCPMKALAGEIVKKFQHRLKSLQVNVRELTGDMQLTRSQIAATHIIVTTPEKLDVVSRKQAVNSLLDRTMLIIFDEIHLLGEDRGYVLECIIARVHGLNKERVEKVRIIGLSATLPNYEDVGELLQAKQAGGIFFFGPEFRPVPLQKKFIGVPRSFTSALAKYKDKIKDDLKVLKKINLKEASATLYKRILNEICWKEVITSVKEGNQVLIFVHSRRDTSATVNSFLEINKLKNVEAAFKVAASTTSKYSYLVKNSRNADLKLFYTLGFGIHHAGMLRSDRNLVETLYLKGAINVLICTATLAWGVNLPAQTVIIKGTEIYAPNKLSPANQSGDSGFVQISMQDVLQCFGRAGRPQFDKEGKAILITDIENLSSYLKLLTNKVPLESCLRRHLPNCLNAEIASGVISNLGEALHWIEQTFLYVFC